MRKACAHAPGSDFSRRLSEHDQPIAANVLDRQFAAEGPNQRWVGDTTEFVIGGNARLYLAAILDLYSPLHRRLG